MPTPKQIRLIKLDGTANFIYKIFNVLDAKQSNIEPELKASIPKLKAKILNMFETKGQVLLELSEEETSLLKQCADTANYFLTDGADHMNERDDKFIHSIKIHFDYHR